MNAVTNFVISRYDTERIIASNTLLAGEEARRKSKEIEPRTEANNAVEGVVVEALNNNSNNGSSEWKKKMAFYHEAPQQQESSNYRNSAFSVSLQDIVGIDSVGSSQGMVDESTKVIGTHFSNPSSLVTSLSSSRECSPDKTGPTLLGAKMVSSPFGVGSWFPSQMRPGGVGAGGDAISMSHLPVFAAWNDS